MSEKKFTNTDILNYLIKGDDNKSSIVVLFEDSGEVRKFSDRMGEELRNQIPTVLGVKYRVRHNMVQVGEKKLFLGLKQDEDLLLNHYSKDSIQYYGDE